MFIFANKTVQSVPWNKGKLTGQKPRENGGDKLVHGSGGISQPRAE